MVESERRRESSGARTRGRWRVAGEALSTVGANWNTIKVTGDKEFQPDQEGNSMGAVLVIVTDASMTVSQIQTALTKASNAVGSLGAAGVTVKQYEGHGGQTS
jgi:hypothetical protein